MASTTYNDFVDLNKINHPGDFTEMYAAQRRFRDAAKTFAMCKICTLHTRMNAMVCNAGQLPQPFWLGAACGGGSRSAAPCAART